MIQNTKNNYYVKCDILNGIYEKRVGGAGGSHLVKYFTFGFVENKFVEVSKAV